LFVFIDPQIVQGNFPWITGGNPKQGSKKGMSLGVMWGLEHKCTRGEYLSKRLYNYEGYRNWGFWSFCIGYEHFCS
jgi:hypothetical protein